ncbi:hypothetical protein HBI59_225760 [Parastagonospora nodorum]|nr:hypothetical protein HBI59_225760 [Parastagonospora nodorum]
MLHRVSTPVLYAHIKQPSHVFGSLLRTYGEIQHYDNTSLNCKTCTWTRRGGKIPYDTTSGRSSDAKLLIEGLSEELGMDPIDLFTRYNHGEHIWSAMCALLAPRLKHVAIVLHHQLLI